MEAENSASSIIDLCEIALMRQGFAGGFDQSLAVITVFHSVKESRFISGA